jgi:hypothetical protein
MTPERSVQSARHDQPAPSSRPLFILIGVIVAIVLIGVAAIIALIGLVTITSSETTYPPTPVVAVTPAQPSGGAIPGTITQTPTVVTTPVALSATPIAIVSPGVASPTPTVGVPSVVISTTPVAVASPVTAFPTPGGEQPPAIQAARFTLATQLRVQSPDEVRIVSWEQVEWPDGCLGIPIRDTMCTQAILPGYRIVLENKLGLRYVYRADLAGSQVLLELAPPTGIERPALTWEGHDQGNGVCQALALAPNGEALVGPCGAPPMPLRLFDEMGRTAQLTYFLNRFAPFTTETPAGQIEFFGRGQEKASAVWQRAIAEWSRLAQRELLSGRGGASWGLALAWHQPEGTTGRCRNLQVEVYGIAFASTSLCDGGDAAEIGQDWLSTDDLVTLYGWLDRFSPLERPLPRRLVFSGAGAQTANDTEVASILNWAERQFDDLSPVTSGIAKEKALEVARQIDPQASWQARYVADYEYEEKGRTGRRPAWIVEAVYPLGNKVVALVDASDGTVLQVAQVEPPIDSAPTLKYMWPTRTPRGLVMQPGQSAATDTSFVLELAQPGDGQFRATIVGGREPRARDRAYGVGGQPVTIHGEQAMAYTTGAGYSVYWAEDSQLYAVISSLALSDAVALAEGLEALDRSAWQQRLAGTR